MRTRYALDLAEVEPAIRAGIVEARQNGWNVTIAVVDDSGTLIQLTRMDDASPASVDTGIEKARAAGLTGVDTKLLEAMVKERPALTTMKRVAIEGGLPILFKGQKLGGVGVSGVQSHQDSQVAAVVIATLNAAFNS